MPSVPGSRCTVTKQFLKENIREPTCAAYEYELDLGQAFSMMLRLLRSQGYAISRVMLTLCRQVHFVYEIHNIEKDANNSQRGHILYVQVMFSWKSGTTS